MIVDTHVHVFTDDRKKYPQIRDTERAGNIPSITEIGQTEWPLTTVEILMKEMDAAGIDKATLVQAYFVYEYDNRYTIDATRAYPERFSSVVVLDPVDPKSPDELSRLVETQGVAGIRFMRGRLPESSLGKPETFPLWERIEQLKIPLHSLGHPEFPGLPFRGRLGDGEGDELRLKLCVFNAGRSENGVGVDHPPHGALADAEEPREVSELIGKAHDGGREPSRRADDFGVLQDSILQILDLAQHEGDPPLLLGELLTVFGAGIESGEARGLRLRYGPGARHVAYPLGRAGRGADRPALARGTGGPRIGPPEPVQEQS